MRRRAPVLLVLACCHQRDADPPAAPSPKVDPLLAAAPEHALAPEPVPKPEALPACDDSFELNLKGLTEEQVQRRFGPPSRRESFHVKDRGGEFYATVQHAYPTTDRKNWDVPIEEWTWTSGECILTVWCHRPAGVWTALDDIYRNERVAF